MRANTDEFNLAFSLFALRARTVGCRCFLLALPPCERQLFSVFEKIPSGFCHAQGGVFAAFLEEKTFVNQQLRNLFEIIVGEVIDNAVNAEFVVSEFSDALGVRAPQHLIDVPHAEPLARASHRGQDFLRDDRGVECLFGGEANIAAPAVFIVPFLTEIAQQVFSAARLQFAKRDDLRQFLLCVLPLCFVLNLVDKKVLLVFVAIRVEQDAVAGQAIASGPARFLIVAFQGFGQIAVNDQAYVGFVYAHAKGDGRHDDRDLIAYKLLLCFTSHLGLQTRVIGQRVETLVTQVRRQRLGIFAGKAVYDGRFAPVFFEQIEECAERISLGPHRVIEVGAVKTSGEYLRLVQAEVCHNVSTHALGGCGCQRDKGYMGQSAPQVAEDAVVGTKIAPPFGYTMRFVNGDETDFERAEKVLKTRQCQSFRGDVQDAEITSSRLCLNPA